MQAAEPARAPAAHAPYLQPQRRPAPERMSFNEQIFIIKDYGGQYVELQFEEVRLRDYRAPALDDKLFELEASAGFQRANPLNASALASSQVRSPTINTRFAMEQLQGVLTGTPTLNAAAMLQQGGFAGVGASAAAGAVGVTTLTAAAASAGPSSGPSALPSAGIPAGAPQPPFQLDPGPLVSLASLTARPYSGTMGPDGDAYCGVAQGEGILRSATDRLVARNQRRAPLMQRSGLAETVYGGSRLGLSGASAQPMQLQPAYPVHPAASAAPVAPAASAQYAQAQGQAQPGAPYGAYGAYPQQAHPAPSAYTPASSSAPSAVSAPAMQPMFSRGPAAYAPAPPAQPIQVPVFAGRRDYTTSPIPAGGNIHDFDTDLGLAELMGGPGPLL